MKAQQNASRLNDSVSCCSSEHSKGTDAVEKRIKGDYKTRGLDFCHFCGLKFNVGERIPRIIVGCGHTFCTSCLTYFCRNGNIRCPMCRKILKGVEAIEKLPLNFNILYEVVTRDPLLSSVNFDKCLAAEIDENDEFYETELEPYLCHEHEQRIKHFYCSEHPSIFCRECIKDLHNMEACYVVDLYEIEKMRKLQEQNNNLNSAQLKNRTDGAQQSCILPPSPSNHENPLLKNVKGARPKDNVKKALFKPQAETAKKPANDITRQKQQLKAVPIENGDLEVNGNEIVGKAAKARLDD